MYLYFTWYKIIYRVHFSNVNPRYFYINTGATKKRDAIPWDKSTLSENNLSKQYREYDEKEPYIRWYRKIRFYCELIGADESAKNSFDSDKIYRLPELTH